MRTHTKTLTASLSVLIASIALTANAATVVPSGYTDSSVGAIPGNTYNAYGSVVSDAAGNVYATETLGSDIIKFPSGGGVSTISAGGSGYALSLAVSGNELFSGLSGGQIRQTNLNTNLTSIVGSIGSDALAMTIAPLGFGAYGGNLIVGGINGLFAFNTTSHTVTQFAGGNYLDGVAFNSSGELIVGEYNSGQVSKVSASGVFTSLFSAGGSLGGIAVRQDTGEIFVANEGSGTISRYSAAGASLGVFASGITWDGGYWPSALSFSADGTSLYYMETPSYSASAGVREISGFTAYASTVPDSSTTVALLGSALLGLSALRRRVSRA